MQKLRRYMIVQGEWDFIRNNNNHNNHKYF